MSPVVSPDRWSCPECGYTVVIATSDDNSGSIIADVQRQHAEAHAQLGQEPLPPRPTAKRGRRSGY